MANKKREVTIKDIARALNLNVSSVSRALSNHPKISDETKKRVLATAKKLNYKPNKAAYTLRTGKGRTIGVIVPRVNRFFFSNAIHGIEQVAAAENYQVIICQSLDSPAKEHQSINALLGDTVAGVIASITPAVTAADPYSTVDAAYRQVLAADTPLVFFNMACLGLDASQVVVDDALGGYLGTQHLIAQGRDRIAFFAGHRHLHIYKQRHEGYQKALAEAGIPYDERLVAHSDLTEADGYQGMAAFMALSPRPNGLFGVTDYLAFGAIKYLKAHGFGIPDDVAVLGFMNEPFNDLIDPPLSSIDQHSYNMGQEAAKLLFHEIRQATAQRASRKIVLSPKLVVRASSNAGTPAR